MTIIGITGHRGSGKTSVGYLLGNTINAIRKGSDKEDIRNMFKAWSDTIRSNEDAIHDCPLYYVYFDEFGDMPKSFVAQLLAIDMSVLDNDTMKDKMYVNMSNFKIYPYNEGMKVVSADDILAGCKRWKEVYISLREFTKVFSIDIMQRFFGSDVWLKSKTVTDEKWSFTSNEGWTIFSDVKTKDEIKYIKDHEGILIRTSRPSHKKTHVGITNIESADTDFIIDTEGPLYDLFDKIYDIAEKIYDKTK